MAILRTKDIRKMSSEDRTKRLKELQFELTKAHVTSNKAKAKTKEIKRAIARLLTINNTLRVAKTQVDSGDKTAKTRKGALSKK